MEKNISYEKSIVAFLDVLGFKNKIKSSNSEESVKKFFGILNYIQAWNTSNGKNFFIEPKDFCNESYIDWKTIPFKEIQKELQITYFSDSLVISLPYKDSDLNTKLFLIIRSLAYLISRLSLANFFVSGGISIGKMFHKSNMFFGPAFLESYKLESEIAIYPRVILSKEVVSSVNNMPYIKEVEDGVSYIDWIDFMRKSIEKEGKTQAVLDNVDHIRELINQNIEENKDNLKIITKYTWLKNHI
jgi:hypothetical protein